MGFLDSLTSTPGPIAAKTAAKTSSAGRPAAGSLFHHRGRIPRGGKPGRRKRTIR